jgi:hypothetical protein
MPRRYTKPFKNRCRVWKNGRVFDTGKFRGKYAEDKTNRLIYDFTKPLAWFSDNSVLHADGQCWVLDKPQFRID